MRFRAVAVVFAAAVFLAGCSKVVSLHAFASDEDSIVDPALIGTWHSADGDDTIIVKQAGNHYSITYVEKSSDNVRFDAWMFVVGDAKLLDLVPVEEDGFHVAIHTPVRVWQEGNSVRFAFLDSDWMKGLVLEQLMQESKEERTLITAPSNIVRKFFMKYGADAKAFGEPEVFQKE